MRAAVALLPFASLALFVPGGCAPQPHPEDYANLSNYELCANYAYENSLINTPEYLGKARSKELRELARAEIEKRNLIPATDWPAIDHGLVVFNMRQCSVLAAWGKPNADTTTQTSHGTVETLVYNSGNVAILTNGAVTSITSRR